MTHRLAVLVLAATFTAAGTAAANGAGAAATAASRSAAATELADLEGSSIDVVLRFDSASLDRVLVAIGKSAGFEVHYVGYTPVLRAAYDRQPARDVLEDLARRFGLEYEVVSPSKLAVRAPLAPTVGGVEKPEILDQPPPTYPDEARREGVTGRVVLTCVILEDGSVGAVDVVRSPDDRLSAAAIEAVRRWRYRPATRNGVPVPVYFTVMQDFTIDPPQS